jgi:hypothetical protein
MLFISVCSLFWIEVSPFKASEASYSNVINLASNYVSESVVDVSSAPIYSVIAVSASLIAAFYASIELYTSVRDALTLVISPVLETIDACILSALELSVWK